MLLSPYLTRQLYEHAVENRYAILAVNADSPAAITDCLYVAKELDAPIIIETSLWQLTGYSWGAGDPVLGMELYIDFLLGKGETEEFAGVPIVYHTDHIKGPFTLDILQYAMDLEASSISLDSSEMTAEENIDHILQLCFHASELDLQATLEMEAGVDDGVTALEETKALFGEVERQAPGYLALWAPGVGTRHGLGDMAGFSAEAVEQHQQLATELAGRPIGIALHGSSGLTNAQLQAGVRAGVAKVNWSSESLLIRSQAAREYYSQNGDKLEKGHPEFKVTAMDNGLQSFISQKYQPKLKERIEVLGGAGQASRYFQRQNL
jgi:fructose-bisphosphate aldolase class II